MPETLIEFITYFKAYVKENISFYSIEIWSNPAVL